MDIAPATQNAVDLTAAPSRAATESTNPKHLGKIFFLAWLIDGLVISCGGLVSLNAALGAGGGPLDMAMAAAPFVALSAIEMTRIPTIYLMTQLRGAFILRVVALALLSLATAGSVEQLRFAFEIGFHAREQTVESADARYQRAVTDHQIAQQHIVNLGQQRDAEISEIATLTKRAQASSDETDREIASLRAQLGAGAGVSSADLKQRQLDRLDHDIADANHRLDIALATERRHCAIPGIADCRLRGIDAAGRRGIETLQRQRAALEQDMGNQANSVDAQIASVRAESTKEQASLHADRDRADQRRRDLEASIVTAQRDEAAASQAVEDARRAHANALTDSPLHRFTMQYTGRNDPAAVAEMKGRLVNTLAVIVSCVGSVIAMLAFGAKAAQSRRSDHPPFGAAGSVAAGRKPPKGPVVRAVLGLLYRIRRRIRVEDIEKIVPVRDGTSREEVRGILRRSRGQPGTREILQ